MNKYNETDFTEENYKQILTIAKENYKFIFYSEIDQSSQFVLWRHDVDFSVHRALQLAKIEHELELKSTYFIMLSSNFYNIFEKEIKKIIASIIELGHEIGLHFDPTIYDIHTDEELIRWLKYEKNTIENLFDIKITTFSFHNPTIGRIMTKTKSQYAEMINTYSTIFFEDIKYCSDSNGYWRYERLEELLRENNYEKLQILTHPVWWVEKPMKARERVLLAAQGRFHNQMKDYDKLLDENGRDNVK